MNGCGFIVGPDGAAETGIDAAVAAFGSASFVWIHLDGRVPDCVAWLRALDNIPDGVVPALVAVETRPRCEPFGNGALLNMRGLGAVGEEHGDPLISVRLWAEKGRVISVCFRTLPAIDTVRQATRNGDVRDPGDLISTLAVAITETLDPDVAALGDLLDDCETTLSPTRSYTMRQLIAGARAKAIGYRRFVAPQHQALERAANLDADWLEELDRIHLRAAADRFARMTEELESVRERAALMHEQLTDLRAEQTDQRTLVISIVALVFLPLTFISGLLGMNVEGIPFAHEPWAFWGVVGVCTAIAVAVTGYFLRAHWFRN